MGNFIVVALVAGLVLVAVVLLYGASKSSGGAARERIEQSDAGERAQEAEDAKIRETEGLGRLLERIAARLSRRVER